MKTILLAIGAIAVILTLAGAVMILIDGLNERKERRKRE